jgi:hypothetical protein
MNVQLDVITTFSTAAAFVATAVMAWKTSELAKDTVDASDLADRHHQEALMPHVYVSAVMRSRMREYNEPTGKVRDWFVSLEGELVNVGMGPALDIRLFITRGEQTTEHYVGFCSPKERKPITDISWSLSSDPAPGKAMLPFSIAVNYDTVFRSSRTTTEVCRTGRHNDLHVEMGEVPILERVRR